ncbi:MAG: hypothetical protein EOO46_12300 [Flavobacterium sp.]|nr:MAG: hypothetical protein EOO46_12300 [Flavobacterium sp.]
MMKYNAPIQMIAVLLCGIGNRYLYAEDSTLYFFMPGITWAIALLLPILKYSFDTKFALVLFPMANMVLWFLGLALSATFGTLMFAASPLFVFPLVGAIGALCAYLLYAKLVLDVVERKDAFICMVLGYASFMLYMFVNYNGSYKVAIEGLFVYWQPFVGLGCVIAHVRRMNSLRQNPTPLTDAS